jgi:Protein of unknown function (DUF5672)
MQKVAVVIPIYQNVLSINEKHSLQRCLKILSSHPIILLKPISLNIDGLLSENPVLQVRNVADSYLDSVKSYNKLLMSKDFFSTFADFEFILIYQLDAFVFKDELLKWCDSGYDYIGAPWLSAYQSGNWIFEIKKKMALWFKIKHPNGVAFRDIIRANSVGNGGFSLRNVKKSLEIIKKFQPEIKYYTENDDFRLNEDVFWSIEVNRYQQHLKIPNLTTALEFAFESEPERCFKENKERLPFGCHAWERYGLDFWQPYIQ